MANPVGQTCVTVVSCTSAVTEERDVCAALSVTLGFLEHSIKHFEVSHRVNIVKMASSKQSEILYIFYFPLWNLKIPLEKKVMDYHTPEC